MASEISVMGEPAPQAPTLPRQVSTFSYERPAEPKEAAGFTLGGEGQADTLAAVDDAAQAAKARVAAQDDAAFALLDAPDEVLGHWRGQVRPTVEPVTALFDEQRKAHLSDANRRWLSEEGRQHADQEFADRRNAAFDAVEQRLVAQLDKIERDAAAALQAERTLAPSRDDEADAFALINTLGRTTPAHGLKVLADLVRMAAESGERGALFVALPLLSSLYDGMDGASQWKGNSDLLRLTRAATALVNTSARAKLLEGRLEKAHRARWELGELLKASRESDPRNRSALQMRDGDGKRVLFDDPQVAPPPTGRSSWPVQKFRRATVSAEQRAADRKRREERAEDE